MRSMTGFGRTQFNFQTSVITIEVTSINKRNFEVLLHGPREWHSFEIPASKVVSKKIERGRIRINVSIAQNDITSTKAIDLSVVEEDVKSLQSVMQRLGLDSKVCSNTIIELYKIRQSEISELPPLAEISTLLENQLVKAIDNLLTMKLTEGEKFYEDMSNRLTRLDKITCA